MSRILAVIFVLSCVLHVNSYMLNEVQKDTITANADNLDEHSKNIARRNYHASRTPENNEGERNMAESGKKLAENSIEKVILALKNGIKNVLKKHNLGADFLDKYAKTAVDYVKGNTEPLFRAASEKYNINPEVIHFRSDKPTLKIEINPTTISKVISDFLQSEAFTRHFDNVVQQVAIVYRTFKED